MTNLLRALALRLLRPLLETIDNNRPTIDTEDDE